MRKYSDLETITKEYLNGTLERLKIEYEDDHTMRVEVMYVDHDEYHLFYVVDIHQENQTIEFDEHYCNYGRDFINLRPNKTFEHHLQDYFFPKKETTL